MARILSYLDAPLWKAVRDLYLSDHVVEALREAEKLGGQDSNDLYAEAEVRSKGSQWRIRPWLTVEAIESETGHLQHVLQIIGEECETISKRFGWDNRESTWVSVLPQDVEAPWMPGRWGYFVDKIPYDKICLPSHLVHDLSALRRTIQHEFMHDVTLNLSHGQASRWISEAMSTFAEGRLDLQASQDFRTGKAEWLSPTALEAMVATDNRDQDLQRKISQGYAQANFIARYLVSHGGEAKIGRFLREIGDESVLHLLENQILSRSRTDAAFRSVYKRSEVEIFKLAHEALLP